MTKVRLQPRLNALGVSQILDLGGKQGPSTTDARKFIEENPSLFWFAASGGTVSLDLTNEVAHGIQTIAESLGFPRGSTREQRALFDTEASKLLGAHADLRTGEQLRDDVWACLASTILPNIVAWRFPSLNSERFAGGNRNCFQRLWMRGVSLDLGPDHPERWKLVEGLNEDAMVAIFERPSIASDERLVRSIATAWLVTAGRIGSDRMEGVMRKATKYIRLRNEIIDVGFLGDEERDELVLEAFGLASRSL